MKFSCPQCSAKYQIADEKVAGRTVKMKCRKCGTVIPIRAKPSTHSMAAAPVVRATSLKPGIAPAPPTVPAQIPAAEWHAGIHGSAVGPLTLTELQSKIDSGDVTSETFIWKEGMDGWKPVPEVPEVAPYLRQIAPPPSMPPVAKAQVAPAAPAIQKPVAPAPAPAPAPVVPKPAPPAPAAVIPMPAAVTASNPVINQSGPAAIPSLHAPADQGNPTIPVPPPSEPEPVTAAKPVLQPAGAAGLSGGGVAPEGVESAAPPAGEAPAPHIALPSDAPSDEYQPSYDSLVVQLQKKRSGKWAIPFAVVAALGLGLTVGFVLFGDQETKIIRQVVEVPAQIGEARAHQKELERGLEGGAQVQADAAAAAAPTTGSKKSPGTGSQQSKSTSTKAADEKVEVAAGGLKGLKGLEGLGGPSGGPSTSSGSTASGTPLEAGQIQKTVAKYQTSVKRGCWQPALMTRDKDAPSSARVTVSITVSSSGSVTRASTGGDPKGYRGLSSCISRKVRGWRFPRSSGTTTVNVPFVFAAQ